MRVSSCLDIHLQSNRFSSICVESTHASAAHCVGKITTIRDIRKVLAAVEAIRIEAGVAVEVERFAQQMTAQTSRQWPAPAW